MIVTDSDIAIADYAVKSYAKIKNIPFKLRVYSNWVSSGLKEKYFSRWRKYSFVELIDNPEQTDDNKPTDPKLKGPFKPCEAIWDRELNKIQTPYLATVDADFEVLDDRFISAMLAQLDANPNLVAMSTDYSQTISEYYDSYSDEVICLNSRWHTWFCIYKREALQCTISHFYYEEITAGPIRRNAWDSSGYFQKTLKDMYGFDLAVLDSKYQRCFIHYGAFSKNRSIDETNVGLYRRLQILCRRGLFGRKDFFTPRLAGLLNRFLFPTLKKERSKYLPGYGQQ